MSAVVKTPLWYQRRLRLIGWSAAAALLALPAIAMSVGVGGVLWTAGDFAVFAVLLALLGTGIELAVSRSAAIKHQAGAALMALAAFLTVWVNLAVGMIGDGATVYNIIVLAMVLIVVAGAVIVRGRPDALAKIALAAAAVQFTTAAAAIPVDPAGGKFSMAFALPWLLAAALLRTSRPAGTASSGRTGSGG